MRRGRANVTALQPFGEPAQRRAVQPISPLVLELLQQQCFDVAVNQHGNVGLDPRRPLKLGAFTRIERLNKLARHARLARQKFDFSVGIGRPDDLLRAHQQGLIIHKGNYTDDATWWLFCNSNLP